MENPSDRAAALKRSPALLVRSRAVSAGKHIACFEGGVAEVFEAMAAGRQAAGALLLDDLELAFADPQVWPMLAYIGQTAPPTDWDQDDDAEALAIVETATVCAAIRAAEAACKVADVVIRDLRLAHDLAGKAYFTLTGRLDAVVAAGDSAAAAAVAGRIGPAGMVQLEVIAQPAPELRGRLFR
jgi:microcompartment protein CcmL/EutN